MELRKILFSLTEISAAVVAHCRQTGIDLPDARVARVMVSENPRETVVLHFRPSMNPTDPARVALSQETVASAIISYCKTHRIPLPRHGRKVLWPQEEGIALMITMSYVIEDASADDGAVAPRAITA